MEKVNYSGSLYVAHFAKLKSTVKHSYDRSRHKNNEAKQQQADVGINALQALNRPSTPNRGFTKPAADSWSTARLPYLAATVATVGVLFLPICSATDGGQTINRPGENER
ncbi:hypothetical protein GWI33_005970 [Rhynchophorus ferrugineus]|uniref:Uncharacterized protein n=1 Tax=Rhynchophorus ferrugineus TaxID=354439 RepID=A0A834J046_RHYFE|nr:hypothetical protein GWI33_005970 [Rhynchophorus ferrugineus]